MVNEFKLIVVHCTAKPDADLCMRVDLPLDKKLWKIRTGPSGRWAITGRGPLGAMGCWAFRPLGRSGRRACWPAFSKTLLKVVSKNEIQSLGFHFLLVKSTIKCGVDKTWWCTSAFFIHKRFHGH